MKNNECKKRGYHSWSDKNGTNVESIGESYEEMDVIFKCSDCGAEANGVVYWENEEND